MHALIVHVAGRAPTSANMCNNGSTVSCQCRLLLLSIRFSAHTHAHRCVGLSYQEPMLMHEHHWLTHVQSHSHPLVIISQAPWPIACRRHHVDPLPLWTGGG